MCRSRLPSTRVCVCGQHVECALTEPWALEIANQEREPCPPDCAACARIAEIEALS